MNLILTGSRSDRGGDKALGNGLRSQIVSGERTLPDHVEIALENWEFLAFTAYDWFEKMGRLVVGIEEDDDNPGLPRLLAVTYDSSTGKTDPKTDELLAKYEPETEIIIQFADPAGGMRTQRLHTAEGARHPKRVWFFEMLRRAEEEPELVEIDELPRWFVEATMKLTDGVEKGEW